MNISAISNINFKQNNTQPAKQNEKKGLSTTAKTMIGAGVVAAGTLAAYFITRKPQVKPMQKTQPESEVITETKDAVVGLFKDLKIKDNTPKEILEKIDAKILDTVDNTKSEFNNLTERVISKTKNGKTKVEYNGVDENRTEFKEIFVFNKDNELQYKQTEKFELETTMGQFPVAYVKSSKFTFPDNKTYSTTMTYALDMRPRKRETIAGDKTRTLIYYYDCNNKTMAIAKQINNEPVLLKFIDKKHKDRTYPTFEKMFEHIPSTAMKTV